MGYRRSGSRSLAEALSCLGFRSIHWRADDGRTTDQIIKYNKELHLPLLSGYDEYAAFFDYPIYTEYHELHRHYPEARFICTYRDPVDIAESWQRKCERHQWETGIWVDGIYRPTTTECKDIAEAHYTAMELIARNNDNFLTMDVRVGWKPLCDFLGLRVPLQMFPWVKH